MAAHKIEALVDIRTVPRSRHNPQFNRELLPGSLSGAGLTYEHLPALGGLRHASKDSLNTGWRNSSFRGYADYMQTPEFEAGLLHLIQISAAQRTVVMCAESLPWRCHRSLVADSLLVHSIPVRHIMSAVQLKPHELTSFAVVNGNRITYPPENLALDLQSH